MVTAVPRRVLVVDENLSVPFDRRVWHECRSLARGGHDVSVVCPMGEAYDTEPHAVIDGVQMHRYPFKEANGGPAGYALEYARALWHTWRIGRRLSRDRPFDVVHLCNPPDIMFLAVRGLRRRGALMVFDHHDLVPELLLSRFGAGRGLLHRAVRWAERSTFARADAVLATNESYRAVATGRGRMPPDRVAVVRSAPDLDKWQRVAPDPSLRRGRPHLACYLGVMGPQDGVDQALRALAAYHHEMGRDDLRTIFLGAGDAFDDAVALMSELDLADHVEFTGRVPDETVLRVLSTADVAIAPDPRNPLNDVSTMNKIMEYMAIGVPIVSFDLVESRRSAEEAAVYVAPGDHAGFARAIAGLVDSPAERERRGRFGRERVARELAWDSSERALLAAYDRLSPRRRAR